MPSTKTALKFKEMKSQLSKEFWEAHPDTLFTREFIAAGLDRSIAWMELTATKGGGVPFLKCGRRCLYRKSDALAWLDQNSQYVHSTREYA